VSVDYDRVAAVYDRDAIRQKEVDRHLATFIDERGREDLRVLDIGCGTGNQLVADVARYPRLRATGVDRSEGMLARARAKSNAIEWVRADVTALPFADAAFDYASMQFVIHHVDDGGRGVREVRRTLDRGGRFVIITLSPPDQPGFLVYRYWPATRELDLRRFAPATVLENWCHEAGFARVTSSLRIDRPVCSLGSALALAHDRSGSQLVLISDAQYREGLERLEHEWGERGADASLEDEIALVTIVADA
jgi:ubiquinone/menaquinone biosynthesis C-methylase UbiE